MTTQICSQQLLAAVINYVEVDADEADEICQEAVSGNMAAQYIVGVALLRENRCAASEYWLHLSANQGYGPAIKLFTASHNSAEANIVGAIG